MRHVTCRRLIQVSPGSLGSLYELNIRGYVCLKIVVSYDFFNEIVKIYSNC